MRMNLSTNSTLECEWFDVRRELFVCALIINLLVASANFLEPRCFGSGARPFAIRGNPIWRVVIEELEKRPYSLSTCLVEYRRFL